MPSNKHEIPEFNPYRTGARIVHKWRRAILFLSPEAERVLDIASRCGRLQIEYDDKGKEKSVRITSPSLAQQMAEFMNAGVTKFLKNVDIAILTEIISEGIKQERKPILEIPPDPYWEGRTPEFVYPDHILAIVEKELGKRQGDLETVVLT